jgi:copper chaperone CopZ
MNIDGALEDTQGIISATTNYAQAMTKVTFDPQQINIQQIQNIIEATGYGAQLILAPGTMHRTK